MVVQHNISGMNSNRQLGLTTSLQAKSSEKLSSGYRINRAADDAAGLAISEKMRRQVRGLFQASSNTQDGISYVQVADAALAEIDDMLARIDELCVKAANDPLTADDRTYINEEIQALKTECNRTFHTTTFNDKLIWDENTADRRVIGHENRPIFTWSQTSNYSVPVTNPNGGGAWPKEGIKIEADDEGVMLKWTGFNGKSYASNKVTWPSEETLKNGFTLPLMSSEPEASDIKPDLYITLDKDLTLNDLVAELNGKTIGASGNLSVYGSALNSSGQSVGSISGNISNAAGLVYRKNMAGDEDRISGYPTNTTNRTDSAENASSTVNFKFSFGKYNSDDDTFVVDAGYSGSTNTSASVHNEKTRGIWWDQDIYGYHTYEPGGTDPNLEEAIKKALAPRTNKTGQQVALSDVGGTLTISFSMTSETKQTYENTTELGTNNGGVGSFKLSIYVPQNSSIENAIKDVISKVKSITSADISKTTVNSKSLSNGSAEKYAANIYTGTMLLNIQAGTNETDENIIPLIYDVLNNHTLGINDLNTLTTENARKGIQKVKDAARIVDEQRSVFGSYQNRMEHTVKNLDNTVENTQHSESVIRDTDMATEMVKKSNQNILAQAGQAMLAQANQTNQGVMALLQ